MDSWGNRLGVCAWVRLVLMIRSRFPEVKLGKDHHDQPLYLPKQPCVGHAFVFVTYHGHYFLILVGEHRKFLRTSAPQFHT